MAAPLYLPRSPFSAYIPSNLTSKILATLTTRPDRDRKRTPLNRPHCEMQSTQRLRLDDGAPEEHYELTVSATH